MAPAAGILGIAIMIMAHLEDKAFALCQVSHDSCHRKSQVSTWMNCTDLTVTSLCPQMALPSGNLT